MYQWDNGHSIICKLTCVVIFQGVGPQEYTLIKMKALQPYPPKLKWVCDSICDYLSLIAKTSIYFRKTVTISSQILPKEDFKKKKNQQQHDNCLQEAYLMIFYGITDDGITWLVV